MPKISIIGAGGVIFSKNIITDILLYPELQNCEICLMDIDKGRLDKSLKVTRRISETIGCKPTLSVTTNLVKALKGADYVLTIFRVGSLKEQQLEYEVPKKYGVDQVVADTLGPGGIFRGLRVLPALMEVAKKMEEHCPDAWLLNYVNPMSINQLAINMGSSIKSVGLCHSVQHTAAQLAEYINADIQEILYLAVGLNHQAYFLQFRKDGVDAYPKLKKAMANKKIYDKDKVRFELFRQFGYFVTESSGHNTEYNPYFRKRKDLIKKFCTPKAADSPGRRMVVGESGAALKVNKTLQKNYKKEIAELLSGNISGQIKQSDEYGARIINAIETDSALNINGNVINNGLISNLPDNCCVEVPCMVDGSGIKPCVIGHIPEQLAGLMRNMVTSQILAAEGFLEQDREKIIYAVFHDPLSSAVCSLDEIRKMTNELFAALKPHLSKGFYVK